jgi:hypothetical protein
MQAITLPRETWRAVLVVLRETGLPSMFEQQAPYEPTVRLSLTDADYLRSSNWARVQLGIPLPAEG